LPVPERLSVPVELAEAIAQELHDQKKKNKQNDLPINYSVLHLEKCRIVVLQE
jgi:hypothetical protein